MPYKCSICGSIEDLRIDVWFDGNLQEVDIFPKHDCWCEVCECVVQSVRAEEAEKVQP